MCKLESVDELSAPASQDEHLIWRIPEVGYDMIVRRYVNEVYVKEKSEFRLDIGLGLWAGLS
jgi:hypothetical protein